MWEERLQKTIDREETALKAILEKEHTNTKRQADQWEPEHRDRHQGLRTRLQNLAREAREAAQRAEHSHNREVIQRAIDRLEGIDEQLTQIECKIFSIIINFLI